MLQDLTEHCSDDLWTAAGRNAPVWEQVCHAAFWLNAWARDWAKPMEKPGFHSSEALELEHGAAPGEDWRLPEVVGNV